MSYFSPHRTVFNYSMFLALLTTICPLFPVFRFRLSVFRLFVSGCSVFRLLVSGCSVFRLSVSGCSVFRLSVFRLSVFRLSVFRLSVFFCPDSVVIALWSVNPVPDAPLSGGGTIPLTGQSLWPGNSFGRAIPLTGRSLWLDKSLWSDSKKGPRPESPAFSAEVSRARPLSDLFHRIRMAAELPIAFFTFIID